MYQWLSTSQGNPSNLKPLGVQSAQHLIFFPHISFSHLWVSQRLSSPSFLRPSPTKPTEIERAHELHFPSPPLKQIWFTSYGSPVLCPSGCKHRGTGRKNYVAQQRNTSPVDLIGSYITKACIVCTVNTIWMVRQSLTTGFFKSWISGTQ